MSDDLPKYKRFGRGRLYRLESITVHKQDAFQTAKLIRMRGGHARVEKGTHATTFMGFSSVPKEVWGVYTWDW